MEERERSLSDEKDRPLNQENDSRGTIQSRETTEASSHSKDGLLPEPAELDKNGSPTQDDDPLPLSCQPTMLPATYVVQVPKDQIYRIPPPEHALMSAERHNNQKKQKGSCCFSCHCSFLPFGRKAKKG